MSLVVGVVLASIYLLWPVSKKGPWDRVPWYDLLCVFAALSISAYGWWRIPELVLGFYNMVDTVFAAIAILLVLESVRRVVGNTLLGLTLLFLLYMFFGDMVPGLFKGVTFSWDYAIAAHLKLYKKLTSDKKKK